ncbi:MAG: amidase domain-containing protein [Clostridia bacterium]|nr:amidase domain-containing protein [Clostridia bacterium]
MRIIEYNRDKAVAYARRWAFGRNPAYYDFSYIGGDCTNFASQCLYAGAPVMNFTPDIGWYYRSLGNRSAAWTGVEYFYRFLTENAATAGINGGEGPFAEEVSLADVRVGDFLQLGNAAGDFYHTPIIVGFSQGVPLVAAHTNDAFGRRLDSYAFQRVRCLHIIGARKQE